MPNLSRSMAVAVIACASASACAAEVDYAKCYEALPKDNAARQKLLDGGAAAAQVLADKLTAMPDEKAIQEIIARLDAHEYRVRAAAQEALINFGKPAEKTLQKALAAKPAAESKLRLQGILDKIKTTKVPEGSLDARQRMAIEIIATRGTTAIPLLETIAKNALWESTASAATSAITEIERTAIALEVTEAATAARAGIFTRAQAAAAQERLTARMKAAQLDEDEVLTYRLACLPAMIDAAALRDELKNKLQAHPLDPATRTALATHLLLELDDPAAAHAVAQAGDTQGDIASLAALASMDPANLSLTQKELLAQRLSAIMDQAGLAGQLSILTRTHAAYAACMNDPQIKPAQVVTLRDHQKKVQTRLDFMMLGGQFGEGDWIDGVDLANISRALNGIPAGAEKSDVIRGLWQKVNETLHLLNSHFGVANIPFTMPESYVLTLRMNRKSGADGVYIGFPVGQSRANLNLGGWNNSLSGLEIVAGKNVDNHKSDDLRRKSGVVNNKPYVFVFRVRVNGDKASIDITENQKPFITWTGNPQDLTSSNSWTPEKQTGIGVGANTSDVVFDRLMLRKMKAE